MRVGTRKPITAEYSVDGDHPHACGDKTTMFTAMEQDEGSSPCVWGQAELVTIYGIRVGIIPMRVGTRTKNNL